MSHTKLPWPDRRLSPNARTHFAQKARAVIEAREYAALIARMENLTIPNGPLELHLIFCPPSRRYYDQDNVLAGLKASIDGLFLACGANDRMIQRTVLDWGEMEKPGAVYIEIKELK